VLGSTYGRGTRGSSNAQHRGRKSWHALPDSERKSAKKDILDETGSTTVFELEDNQSHAYVHSKSGTITEIGQADLERGNISPQEGLTLPQGAEKSIHATTTMSVRYSER
jgi:hypothetical protein